MGDDSDHGAGRDGHPGIWYLSSVHDRQTAVAGAYAILTLSHHRGAGPQIRRIDEHTVELMTSAGPENDYVETRGEYRLVAPCHIDQTLTVTARDGSSGAAQRFGWCCYVNGPKDGGIHFLENGR